MFDPHFEYAEDHFAVSVWESEMDWVNQRLCDIADVLPDVHLSRDAIVDLLIADDNQAAREATARVLMAEYDRYMKIGKAQDTGTWCNPSPDAQYYYGIGSSLHAIASYLVPKQGAA